MKDGSEANWLSLVENRLALILTGFFNHLLANDLPLPAKQNLIRQIYLPKSKDPLQRFENCRPISITSPIYKLVDIVLNKKLTAFLDSNDLYKLDTSQTGFRQKIGCEVNILRLVESIQQQKEQLRAKYKATQQLWTLFIDFKSAFDSVSQVRIFHKMKHLGMDRELCNTVKWLYGQTEMYNGRDNSLINQGVIQGGTISPTLFTIFVNDLIARLDKKGFQVFAYADDIAILGTGGKALDAAWRLIWDWSFDNQMQVNKKKSGIIVHKGKLPNQCQQNGTNCHQLSSIPLVESYKYLGVWIDRSLNFRKHLEYTKEKIRSSMKILNIMKWRKCSKWHVIYSWMTYIVPHFRYGALIYYRRNKKGEKTT